VKIVKELPVDKHRLCLTQEGKRLCLELWFKTKRRKSPWDRLLVGSMVDGGGLALDDEVNARAQPFLNCIRGMLPEFDPLAIVLAVNAR
jgi:hypothetical protein